MELIQHSDFSFIFYFQVSTLSMPFLRTRNQLHSHNSPKIAHLNGGAAKRETLVVHDIKGSPQQFSTPAVVVTGPKTCWHFPLQNT